MRIFKEMLEAKKCFLDAMGWIDDECTPQKEIVQEHLDSTLIGESLRGVGAKCDDYADYVIGMLEMGDRKKNKEEEGAEDMMLGAAKNLVYFGCVHYYMEKVCEETTEHILDMFNQEHIDEAWEDSAVLKKLGISDIPNLVIPKYEHMEVLPGQDVYTQQVSDEALIA